MGDNLLERNSCGEYDLIPQITRNINKFCVLESVGKSRICTRSVPWLADSYKLEVISRICWLVVTVGPLPSAVFSVLRYNPTFSPSFSPSFAQDGPQNLRHRLEVGGTA